MEVDNKQIQVVLFYKNFKNAYILRIASMSFGQSKLTHLFQLSTLSHW